MVLQTPYEHHTYRAAPSPRPDAVPSVKRYRALTYKLSCTHQSQ